MRIVCYRKLSNLYAKGKKTIYLPIDSMKQLKKRENWRKAWGICNMKKAVI